MALHVEALARPGRDHGEALAAGLIDSWSNDLASAAAAADMVILAQPVEAIRQSIPTMLAAVRPGTVVTDVGSTKRLLAEAAARCPPGGGVFVGSHPMAGSHLNGWRHARPDLFEGRTTLVTPAGEEQLPAAARLVEFWRRLGSQVILVDPARHDEVCALISHVPHFAAAAVVDLVMAAGEDPTTLAVWAGSGFRDTTRVAMGPADVWTEIATHNAEPLARGLRNLAGVLQRMANAIESSAPELPNQLDKIARFRSEFK
jgi:prephenate dehydrogenase